MPRSAPIGFDIDSALPFMLNKIVRVMNEGLEAAFREEGLSQSDWRVLATLAATTLTRPSEIADFTSVERSTLTRILDRFEDLGLARRSKRPESGRAVDVSVTPSGRRLFAKLHRVLLAEQKTLLSRLEPKDALALMSIVEKTYRTLLESKAEIGDAGNMNAWLLVS